MKLRKTDYGTIILHWLLVAAFSIAFLSGLRIATEAPERTWINLFDAVLPRESVWTAHMQAAVVLVAVSLAYTVYLMRSGLGRRVRLDKIRLRGLFGRRQARLGTVNIVLYWVFFVAMLALIASGGLLYFGYFAGHDMAMVHWYGTWVIISFAGLHILAHYKVGGASQLLRVFRPTHLSAPPPPLDAVELLTLLVEQSARLQPESERADNMPSKADVAMMILQGFELELGAVFRLEHEAGVAAFRNFQSDRTARIAYLLRWHLLRAHREISSWGVLGGAGVLLIVDFAYPFISLALSS